jgi:hypothetical protein
MLPGIKTRPNPRLCLSLRCRATCPFVAWELRGAEQFFHWQTRLLVILLLLLIGLGNGLGNPCDEC